MIERQPVAALATKGERARSRSPATGIVLRGVTAERDLPSLVARRRPRSGRSSPTGGRCGALTIAGAAPDELLRRSNELAVNERGVVVTLQNGPELVFGSADDARAKWIAAARVLAESSAAGATYLDLRIPGRVAAGGLAPVDAGAADPNPQPEAENSPTLNP